MIEFWKKAPKQFEWFALHPNQVMNQAKRIWEKSIRLGDGGLWLYYIFAVCQWLPTNHRSLYNVQIIPNLELCKLCVTGEVEDMKHTLLTCPALSAPREQLKKSLQRKLVQWRLPFAESSIQFQQQLCERWRTKARKELSGMFDIPQCRPETLARDFWAANTKKSTIPSVTFMTHLRRAINSPRFGSQVYSVSDELAKILATHLCLTVDAPATLAILLISRNGSQRQKRTLFGDLLVCLQTFPCRERTPCLCGLSPTADPMTVRKTWEKLSHH